MWKQLTEKQKTEYRSYCDKKFGETFTYSETREPLYFDSAYNMINGEVIMKTLFLVAAQHN